MSRFMTDARLDPIRSIIAELAPAVAQAIEPLIRRAYRDGYKQGTHDSVDKIVRAATGLGEDTPRDQAPDLVAPSKHRARKRREKSSKRYGYGVVISAFRRALEANRERGLPRTEFLNYCRKNFGVELTPARVRHTLKRMLGEGEAIERDGAYYPGPRLSTLISRPGVARPENGHADLLGRRAAHSAPPS